MRNNSINSYRSTYPWPPLPAAGDRRKLDEVRQKLDEVRAGLAATTAKLDRLSTGSDGRMGLDRMVQVIDRHEEFVSDRRGPLGRLFRWFQTR